jgi:RES domain-containing protein
MRFRGVVYRAHDPRWSWPPVSGDGARLYGPSSHALADRLIAAGYVGMRVPSFAPGGLPDDVNLVFWNWSDSRPSRIVLVDDERRLPKSVK